MDRTGFEPVASCLQSRRSSGLIYRPMLVESTVPEIFNVAAADANSTRRILEKVIM